MDHLDATKSMATERYTLDEMAPAERDAFEEHFFDCSECADAVRDATKFAAGVRTREGLVPLPIPVPVPAPARFNWWAVAASVFAAGLSYQSFWVMPHIMAIRTQVAPASLAEAITLESVSRGANEQVVHVVHRDEAVALTFPIETNEPQAFYICEVRDAAGRRRASLSVSRAQASEPVWMVLPPHTLPSGHYKLVIRGGDREIAAYAFVVEVR